MQHRGQVGVWVVVVIVVAAVGSLAVLASRGGSASSATPSTPADEREAIPVEVASVETGPIARRRVFSGSLEATAHVTVAPEIGGRIVTLSIDLADPVTRGQVVATLDRDEHEQFVAQAEADLAVARAGVAEAESAASIAGREFERVRQLHEQSIVSDSELDAARAADLSSRATLAVAEARVQRAEAALRSARIRLESATVRAEWQSGDATRVVAERFAEEGDTVSAGDPLLDIIELDPIEAVVFVTESDYAQFSPGQAVSLTTDAYPGRRWEGAVSRVAPIFRSGSRQARVEVSVPNPDASLKPGMFARVETTLARVDDAITVPEAALAQRDGRPVLFVVSDDGSSVLMVAVEPGIRDSGRVQILAPSVSGRVVTLGQQLLGDGSSITIHTPRETGG
ncbi:MAG: efflux RND transporter periplasmic adaptor subunit [Phycisphaerales bacterium]